MRLKYIIYYFILMFSNCTPALAQHAARVVRVKDGDTYVFSSGTRVFTVRLTKVDAPEMKQAFGFTAYQCVNQLLMGKEIVYDSVGKDLYARVLVSVKLEGKRLDSLLIRNGWAWHYIAYDNETMLDNLMNEAITAHLGLWSCGVNHVCPPWFYRAYSQRNRAKYCKGCATNLLTQK